MAYCYSGDSRDDSGEYKGTRRIYDELDPTETVLLKELEDSLSDIETVELILEAEKEIFLVFVIHIIAHSQVYDSICFHMECHHYHCPANRHHSYTHHAHLAKT